MHFQKVIYENVEKKKSINLTTNISIHTGHRHYEVS